MEHRSNMKVLSKYIYIFIPKGQWPICSICQSFNQRYNIFIRWRIFETGRDSNCPDWACWWSKWCNMSINIQESRKEKEAHFHTIKRQASSCISLANETVNMLSYLTTEIQVPFLRTEILDRFSAMLNYNLVNLVGPKCSNLKVQNPEEYRFNPRNLLADILKVYLNFSVRAEFVASVGRDTRSYNKDLFWRGIENFPANILALKFQIW